MVTHEAYTQVETRRKRGALFALIGLVGIVSAVIAYGWAGMILTTQQNVIGAEVPSSVQTVLR